MPTMGGEYCRYHTLFFAERRSPIGGGLAQAILRTKGMVDSEPGGLSVDYLRKKRRALQVARLGK